MDREGSEVALRVGRRRGVTGARADDDEDSGEAEDQGALKEVGRGVKT